MKKTYIALCYTLCMFFLGGCAAQTSTVFSQPNIIKKDNSRVFTATLDAVWESAIKSLSKDFFVLDNIEKQSGIITLSYALDNPEPYIDCGIMTISNKGGFSNTGSISYPYAQKYTELFVADGTPHPKPAIRRTKLSGKINIVFSKIGQNNIEVTVNTRYILDIMLDGMRYVPLGYTGYMQPYSVTSNISFNTGETGRHDTGGGMCLPKNTLEQMILDKIENTL